MPWDNSIGTFALNEVTPASKLNKIINNLNYLHSPEVLYVARGNGAGNITTSSTTFTDVGTPFQATLDVKAGIHLFVFAASSAGGVNCFYDITIDGVSVSGGNGVFVSQSVLFQPVGIVRFLNLTAGSRTIKLQFKSASAASSGFHNNGTYPFLLIKEISWTP